MIGPRTYNPADWKPGDVALVTTWGGTRRAWLSKSGNWNWPGGVADESAVMDARPLTVLDPESDEDMERLRKEYDRHLAASAESSGAYAAFLTSADQRTEALRAALRAMTRPPKPDEPKALGAVVRDRSGDLWVRMNEVHFERLRTVSGNRQTWGELDVPPDGVKFGGVS